MAKKLGDSMGMDDNDEFFEDNGDGEKGGDDGTGSGDDSGEAGKEENGSGDSKGDSGDDKSGSDQDGSGKAGTGDGDKSGESGDKDGESKSGDDDSGESGSETGDESEEGSEGDDGDGKGAGDSTDDKKSGEGDSGEEKTGSKESGDDEDFFADLEGEDRGEEEFQAIDFKKIGQSFDIELEDGTEEEFTEKVSKKIEDAKQQVDVSKFSPEAQNLVRHLNNNEGKVLDFFRNKEIATLQSVLSQSAEDKVKMVRRPELVKSGSTPEEVETELDEQIGNLSAEQIMQAAAKIDENAQDLIDAEIKKIVGDSDVAVQKKKTESAQKVKRETEALKNYVRNKDSYLGLKLSEKAKSAIIRDIDSGDFDKAASLGDSESRLASYLYKRSGKKIVEKFNTKLSETGREGYNKGLAKTTDKLHKSKGDATGKGTGHADSKTETKNFESWGNMDL